MTKAESAASRTPRVDAAVATVTVPFEREEKILVTEAVPADFARALELEAADLRSCIKDLRERLAKARAEAIEECARECDKVGRMLSYGAGYACKIAAKEIRALTQKGESNG